MQTITFSRGRAVTRAEPFAAPPLVSPSLASVELQARAEEAANLLKALANPDRLLLLCQLVEGERRVTDLGMLSGIAQPSLSQQLGVLRGERLVATRREGKSVIYRIDSPAAMTILQTLYGLFCKPPTGTTAAGARRPGARRRHQETS